MKKPNFFIVGAPRCGTTAMNDYLKQHPEIFIPEAKELHYFGSDLNVIRYRLMKEEYLSYFLKAKNEKRIGEASVWYLYSELAAKEIKEFCPFAKIIIMLRNPTDMLYSLHSQLLYEGDEDIADFESALEAEEDRKRGLRIPENNYRVEILFYREVAKYTEQVERYLNIFGFQNVHIIIFDDFINDTADVYRQTLNFLNVDEDFQPNFQIINPNMQIRSKSLRSFLKNPPQTIQWISRTLMPHSIRRGLKRRIKYYNARYVPRPPLDPELKKRLHAEFVPEVNRLSKLLGLDLSYWCKG